LHQTKSNSLKILKMQELKEKGIKAKSVCIELLRASSALKDQVLLHSAENLEANQEFILGENKKDIDAANAAGIKGALIDRLTLTEARIKGIAEGLRQIAALEDPIGEVTGMVKRPNGLVIGKKRVPMGVIGIIYEARPNVTADVFGLCIKTGNAAILRGGKEAYSSNKAIVKVLRDSLTECKLPADSLQLVDDTSRESAMAMMKLNEYLDILIPRGGAGLIKSVVENSTVPVIETGVGNCHVFIDESAIPEMAMKITVNAKTHRPGVCNAAESLLIHSKIADNVIPLICNALNENNVEIRGDEKVCALLPYAIPANEEDYYTEYLDLIMSVKVVGSLEEAISHINKYGSKHSEAIVTENYTNSQKFLEEVDAAAVYVNASTRFTDGFEFGFGAEIGISTQKLHARGPMGLKELTTSKYVIYGNGQVR
jgi:glutamate-5-semialdehyde dehydrogenase